MNHTGTLRELFDVIESEFNKNKEYWTEKARVSEFGDIEVRSFGTAFFFYLDGEQLADFTVSLDSLGKVYYFIAPTLIKTTVVWDMKVGEPTLLNHGYPEWLVNSVRNHFKTAQ